MRRIQKYFEIWNHSPEFESLSQFSPSNIAQITLVNSSLNEAINNYTIELLDEFAAQHHDWQRRDVPTWKSYKSASSKMTFGRYCWINYGFHWWIIVITTLSFYWLPITYQTLWSALNLYYLLRPSRKLQPLSLFFK